MKRAIRTSVIGWVIGENKDWNIGIPRGGYGSRNWPPCRCGVIRVSRKYPSQSYIPPFVGDLVGVLVGGVIFFGVPAGPGLSSLELNSPGWSINH